MSRPIPTQEWDLVKTKTEKAVTIDGIATLKWIVEPKSDVAPGPAGLVFEIPLRLLCPWPKEKYIWAMARLGALVYNI